MEVSLLEQGITLMLVGMGTVFVFLTILVLGMSMMSLLATKFAPRVPASEEEVAAIAAAITQHRKITPN